MTRTRNSEVEGVCANCHSDDISYGILDMQDEQVFHSYLCLNCGKDGKEFYNIEFVENISYIEK